MAQVLDAIESAGMRWGVVTNKLARFSEPLLEAMGLVARSACIVSGDTCARAKPHPDPLLEAARRLRLPPEACMYVGDDERDIQAARAAGMRSIAALWGYRPPEDDPRGWQADALAESPLQLITHGLLRA
jgi:phosphoglycolate phosphatase